MPDNEGPVNNQEEEIPPFPLPLNTCKECNADFIRSPCETCEKCPKCCQCFICDDCLKSYKEQSSFHADCKKCVACCKCRKCRECNKQVHESKFCENCDICKNCCDCFVCNNCGNAFPADREMECHDCNYCNNCCRCSVHSGISLSSQRDVGAPVFHTPPNYVKKNFLGGLIFNPSKRFIAAEIEVAKSNHKKRKEINSVLEYWHAVAVRDGSLPESGYEINTAPAGGYLFSKQIKEICEAIRAANGYANDTCGLHIHVDCQDFNYYDIRKIIKLYAKLEKPLFSIVSGERQQSRFSKPCGTIFKDIIDIKTPKKWEEALLTNLYGSIDEAKRLGREKYVNSRYHALNLHSWIYRSTIEFRHHHGTTNYVTITNWGILCASLIDLAYKATEDFIDRLPNPDSKEKELELLKIVSPTEENRKWVEERFNQFLKNKKESDGALSTPATRNNSVVSF